MTEKANTDLRAVEILLVEDNPNDAELTLYAFENQHLGQHDTPCPRWRSGLAFPLWDRSVCGCDCRDVPKLILLDLKLPKVSGIDVLRRLRADPRTEMIPVVVLTCSREEKDLVETYRLGVNSYIVKPVEFDKFTDVVTQLGYYWLIY